MAPSPARVFISYSHDSTEHKELVLRFAQRLRKEINELLPLDAGDWLAELGNLRREVLQMEPLNESRNQLLHTLASRDVCSYDACPSRTMAREHAKTNPRTAENDKATPATKS